MNMFLDGPCGLRKARFLSIFIKNERFAGEKFFLYKRR